MSSTNTTQPSNTLLPEGSYPATLLAINVGRMGTQQTPCVTMSFRLEETSRVLTYYGWLTSETAIANTVEALRNVGFTGDELADVADFDPSDSVPVYLALGIQTVPADVSRSGAEYDRNVVNWVRSSAGALGEHGSAVTGDELATMSRAIGKLTSFS